VGRGFARLKRIALFEVKGRYKEKNPQRGNNVERKARPLARRQFSTTIKKKRKRKGGEVEKKRLKGRGTGPPKEERDDSRERLRVDQGSE